MPTFKKQPYNITQVFENGVLYGTISRRGDGKYVFEPIVDEKLEYTSLFCWLLWQHLSSLNVNYEAINA